MFSRKSSFLVLILWAGIGVAATKQQELIQADINKAATALATAEAVGAPLYARAVYEEALSRLNFARQNIEASKKDDRTSAGAAAIQAFHAARAAEAIARAVARSREVQTLTSDIRTFGGNAPEVSRYDELGAIDRGVTSMDRVRYARAILDQARTMPRSIDNADLKMAEENLVTAERLAKKETQSATADHLAYVAEMIARRAGALASLGDLDRELPTLRQERTRLAQAASELQAARERQAREDAERRTAELRAQLEQESASRRAREDELQRLRQQIAENERMVQQRLEEDRRARIEAERTLDLVRAQYQAALSTSADPVEVERLRRQVEDQSIALRSVQERERLSEQSYLQEIERLQRDLQESRRDQSSSTQVLTEREAELARMQGELNRVRTEREESERRRAETEKAQMQAIAAAETARREAETQSALLRQQVAEEKARADQAQAELKSTREEAARKEQERFTEMQKAIAGVAQTRSDERGFIVTLPGIFFDTGKSTLKSGARSVLTRIAAQLKTNDRARVLIEGHTDSVGSDESNMALSTRRAEAVRDFLLAQGVAASVLTTSGKGESAPIATNDTAAGRQQNRRVELVITQ